MKNLSRILREVRRIEMRTAKPVGEILAGQYRSVFRGRGIDFDRVREYVPGDDVRTIDWNVTARAGRPHVKEFTEERELHVVLLVDLSASGDFGSGARSKRQIAADIASVLAFSAIRNRDRVSAVLFTDRIEKSIPPGKGRTHVLRVVRDVLACEPVGHGTDLAGALEHVRDTTPRRAIVFVISDFQTQGEAAPDPDRSDRALRALSLRHDVIAVRIHDRREQELPDVGAIALEDAETGEVVLLDSWRAKVRSAFADEARRAREHARTRIRRAGADLIEVDVTAAYVPLLVSFFRARRRRQR